MEKCDPVNYVNAFEAEYNIKPERVTKFLNKYCLNKIKMSLATEALDVTKFINLAPRFLMEPGEISLMSMATAYGLDTPSIQAVQTTAVCQGLLWHVLK